MSTLLNILKGVSTLSPNAKLYKPFVVDGIKIGLIRPEIIEKLSKYKDVFLISPEKVTLASNLNEYNNRTDAIERVLKELKSENTFKTLKGWRNEYFDVKGKFESKPFFKMDRCATCLFGIKNYGVAINGYVDHPTMGLAIWLQKRSETKERWPGMWDNMVGGGLSVCQGIMECVYRESTEEAAVPKEYFKNIVSTGTVSCLYDCNEGIFPNTAFVFDLLLPLDFKPQNTDGEVEYFHLVPVRDLLYIIKSGKFKKTVIMVAVDFLIRHSVIKPHENPYYIAIVEMLHVELQKIYDLR